MIPVTPVIRFVKKTAIISWDDPYPGTDEP